MNSMKRSIFGSRLVPALLAATGVMVACASQEPAGDGASTGSASTHAPAGAGAGAGTGAGGEAGGGSDAAGAGGSGRFDPLHGDYPQLSWMINVTEVEGPIGLARSGEVIRIDDPARARAESMVFTAGQERRLFESLQSSRGYRLVSAPFVLSRPGQRAEIAVGSRDKAGQSTGSVSTIVMGSLDGDSVHADVECRRSGDGAAAWQRVDRAIIPGSGGVVLAAPIKGRTAPGGGPVWGVVVVRPAIVRSTDDYPFQTSTSVATPP